MSKDFNPEVAETALRLAIDKMKLEGYMKTGCVLLIEAYEFYNFLKGESSHFQDKPIN